MNAGTFMPVSVANRLAANAPLAWRDQTALVDYAASVTTVTPGLSLVISVPSLPAASQAKTFNLKVEGTICLPLFQLN